MLDRVRIVLVNTSHTGNIGSAARAMKTMGLSHLYLVNPKQLPDGQASALAAGAGDILAHLKVVDTLTEAIADCGLVIGTSARPTVNALPPLSPRQLGVKVLSEAAHYPVAIVFGRESSGLTNEELQHCHLHVAIPANPDYSSLNLAAAVQVIGYELRATWLEQQSIAPSAQVYPLNDELERFYEHLQQTLWRTGFIVKNHPGHVMQKLRRLFARARPDAIELNILRGILASIDKLQAKDPNS